MTSFIKIFVFSFIYYYQVKAHEITKMNIIDAFNLATKKITEFSKCHDDSKHKSDGDNPYKNPNPDHGTLVKDQEILEETSRILQKRFDLTSQEVLALSKLDLTNILPVSTQKCLINLYNISCDQYSPFRSFDGSCNNLRHPSWGKSFTCFHRLLHPAYADGISELRKSLSGKDLPLPRKVTLELMPDRNVPSKDISLHLAYFGQFIAHDILSTDKSIPSVTEAKGGNCSFNENTSAEDYGHLTIPKTDPFYSKFGQTHFNASRASICPTCSLGPRHQLNLVTSFIDGSHIYGSTQHQSHRLRNFDGTGTLKHTDGTNGGELLLQSFDSSDQCNSQNTTHKCFEAGDSRVNQQTMVTSFHTIFLRQHNNIAGKLHALNTNWNEEEIFQRARKIVIAQIQMVTYNELLPKLIGKEVSDFFHLPVRRDIFYTRYNPTINPSINSEFAASAYRMGHSLISNIIPVVFNHTVYTERLQNMYSWPYSLYEENIIEGIMQGLSLSPGQMFDRFVATDLSNHLGQVRGGSYGADMVSYDIFGERDNGIPPYIDVVKYCSGRNINSFEDLKSILLEDSIKYYQQLYEYVQDIELLTASYSEKPMLGAIVGPTIACIIAEQFHRLKYGDRFYFEHIGETGSFTSKQLIEIKKTTLTKIICDNTKIEKLQKEIMMIPSLRNPTELCENLPDMDLSVFKNY